MKLWALCGGYWMKVIRARSEHEVRQFAAHTDDDYDSIPYGNGECFELEVDGPIEEIASCSD